jgi:phosphate transport system ATP-binding protein
VDDPQLGRVGLIGEARDLAVSFRGRAVLRGVSLELRANAITAILGRSGAGKTTLLRAFNRLNEELQGAKTRGSLRLRLSGRWREIYAADISLPALRQRVGMVFQTPNLLPMSVERNLSLPLSLTSGLSNQEIAERVERALCEAELWDEVKDRLRSPAAGLSGGQQQRLCLARALALAPEILLLDEPTASLDFKAAERIEDLLRALKERYALVLVSHNIEQARRLADEAVVLTDGRVTARLGREELLADNALEQCVAGEIPIPQGRCA